MKKNLPYRCMGDKIKRSEYMFWFWIMRLVQKNGFNPRDDEHWKARDGQKKETLKIELEYNSTRRKLLVIR